MVSAVAGVTSVSMTAGVHQDDEDAARGPETRPDPSSLPGFVSNKRPKATPFSRFQDPDVASDLHLRWS